MNEALGIESPENLRYSYLDKFQVVDGPCQIPPHKCAGCGHALVNSTDQYVDWGFDVDFYGQIILCVDCFRQAANQLEFMAPEQWKELQKDSETRFHMIQDLLAENKRLRDALASLGLIGIVATDLSLSDAGKVQESGGGSEGGDPPPPAEQESNGQDASKGSTELSGDDTLSDLIAGI